MLIVRRSAGLLASILLLALVPFAASFAPAGSPSTAPPTPTRDIDFYGWWHDAGQLLLHTSNLGFLGTYGLGSEPSSVWPGETGCEHLYGAGIWVGAISQGDTLVSTAINSIEFDPPQYDPLFAIYESASGAPGGAGGVDDDADGDADEDRLDGLDNDADGLVDEDYAAISDEMFAYVSFDTTALMFPNPNDPHTALGLEMYVQSFAWADDAADDFVGLRYEITNISASRLNDVYLGFAADPDVGSTAGGAYSYLDDRVGFIDTTVSAAPGDRRQVRVVMAYAHDALGGDDGDWNGWIGFVLLDHSGALRSRPSLHALQSWESGADDPAHDRERYRYLSQPGLHGGGSYSGDWRFVMSVGPVATLAPGEVAFVELAVVCGDKLEGLLDNAARAVRRHRSGQWSGRSGPLPEQHMVSLPSGSSLRESGRAMALLPPSPNPVSNEARVAFSLAEPGHARLTVYDCAGRRIATLIDREIASGLHEVQWKEGVGELPTGIYLLRLDVAGDASTVKAVVMH